MASFYEFEFSSADAGETEQFLSDRYGRVALTGRLDRIGMRLAGDERFQLASVRFDGEHTAAAETDAFVVASATSRSGWEEARDSGDMGDQPVLFRPGTPFTSFTVNTERRSVNLEAAALQRTARLLYGRDDLMVVFDGPHPVTPQAGASWLRVLGLVLAYRDTGVLGNELIRSSAFRLLSVSALEVFRLDGDRAALRASAERRQRIYRSAVEFFREYASLPITIEDAAEAIGASVSELVEAFHALHPEQCSPTLYLRSVRLGAAFADLRAAAPTTGVTVAQVAQRWGFPSARQFASLFLDRYGVNPERILDRED
ncbi:helix-turn-helix domain-containing protein [Leifsonia sp. NPDC056824]|uniref:helix-turn-helix domain-containing protein n=1 Tax=Leifsonia sp. NPDC056824 TaxID=3345953 RepID=UPI0036BDF15E